MEQLLRYKSVSNSTSDFELHGYVIRVTRVFGDHFRKNPYAHEKVVPETFKANIIAYLFVLCGFVSCDASVFRVGVVQNSPIALVDHF